MPVLCAASVTWFREPGHERVDDTCVLENGHEEFEHLPAGKVRDQGEARVWNAAIDAVLALPELQGTTEVPHAAISALRR